MRLSRHILFAFLLALLAGTPAVQAAATCPANNTLSTPPADFTVNAAVGTVTHLKTGLTWKSCSEGKSWNGSTCTGIATGMNWSAARDAAAASAFDGGGWRLPNLKELQSIVETGCYSPSINETAFPATSIGSSWSSTAYASDPANAWTVNFSNGTALAGPKISLTYVRLVRGGQPFDSFDPQKTNQAISFGAAPSVIVGGTGTVSATGGASGNAVTFTVPTTTSVCTISGSTVTGIAAGTCTVAANQAGNANYNAAPQATQNITVGKAGQTITFDPAPGVIVGGTGTVSATGGASGNAVTFTVPTTTGVCSVTGSTVTGLAAGTCTVAANQAGNANYTAAPQVTQNITIGQAGQTITFNAAPAISVGGTGTVSATGGASGNAVTFTVPTTTGVCSVTGSTVTGLTAGTCTVAANQAGNANYAAAPQATQNITVGQAGQTITFDAAPGVIVGGTGTVSATGGASGNAVTFTVPTTTGICSVTGSTVTGLTAGTCTVAANQAGNANYAAAPQATQNITIDKIGQAISFDPAPSIIFGGTGTVSATGGASGNAVTFTVPTTTGVCSVTGSTVTGLTAGTCTVAANQAGSANYAAAPQATQNITVGQAGQTITFDAAPGVIVGGTGTVSATGGASGNAVTFTVPTTTGICSVTGSTVTGIAAGTCTVAANQAGNANYAAAPQATQGITVTQASVNGACGSANGTTVGSAPAANLCATGSASAVTGSGPWAWNCNGSGGGSNASCSAPIAQPNQTNQTISFGAAPSVVVGGTGTASATATSGLAVSFTSTTTGICTVSGSTVTGVAAGTCTIAANQAGNASYNPAPQVTQNITIGKNSQTISFGAAPSITVGGTGTATATATSGLAVSFTSTTTGICTVSGSTVTGIAAGTCTIAADQAGSASYNPAPQATQNITIGKNSQTISFGAAPGITVGGTATATATATSGLAVSFTSTTTGICTVSGSTVTGVAAGTCAIAANQAGNASYNPAPQATQSITVTQAPVNGACGSANGIASAFAPNSNLCTAGAASVVTAGSPWSWACNGSGGGTNANCSAPNQTTGGGSGSSGSSGSGGSGGSGGGRAVISGSTWAADPAQSAGFVPISGHAKSPPSLPPGSAFPYGLFDFTLNAGTAGTAATIAITYPAALPAGAVYWKYGPSPAGYNCSGGACAAPHWYQMPAAQAVFAGDTVTLTIVDGGVGDDDLAANGTIVDQGGPGVPDGGVAGIPTLSEWALLALAGLMGLLGMGALRRRAVL